MYPFQSHHLATSIQGMVYNWAKNSQNEDFYIKNLNKEMFRSNLGFWGPSHLQLLAKVDRINSFGSNIQIEKETRL